MEDFFKCKKISAYKKKMRLFSSPAWLLAAMPFFVIVLLLSGSVEAARADRYFVDYEGNTGYYVDVNSIELPSDHEVELDLYLVKLHSRYMYRYRAYFDTAEVSYEYRNARVYDYETKKLMSGADHVQEKLSYSKSKGTLQFFPRRRKSCRGRYFKNSKQHTWYRIRKGA